MTNISLPLYQVDAFLDNQKKLFSGNPAAVCQLDHWLDDDVLLAIAAENNLSETAFFVPITSTSAASTPATSTNDSAVFELRWFTPTTEVELCGHATLATAHVLFAEHGLSGKKLHFKTKFRGDLFVEKTDQRQAESDTGNRICQYRMSLPANPLLPLDAEQDLQQDAQQGLQQKAALSVITNALGLKAENDLVNVLINDNWLLHINEKIALENLQPDFVQLAKIDPTRGFIVTRASQNYDFISRYFAPSFGINEDPVTGSAHATLAPYWAKRLNKNSLVARQCSARGGLLLCETNHDIRDDIRDDTREDNQDGDDNNNRVYISGDAKTVIRGELLLDV